MELQAVWDPPNMCAGNQASKTGSVSQSCCLCLLWIPGQYFNFCDQKKALISIYAHLMPELALLHRREVCCLHLCACWVNRHFLQTLLPFVCHPRGKWEVAMEGCVLGFCWTVCQVSSWGLKGDKSPSPQSSWLLPQLTQQTKANYLCSDINIYV